MRIECDAMLTDLPVSFFLSFCLSFFLTFSAGNWNYDMYGIWDGTELDCSTLGEDSEARCELFALPRIFHL
jgi:hypothetical protein